MATPIDGSDAHILEMLQSDARVTQQEIARAVGLSQPAVAERIRKLETQGIVTGYIALVDANRVGRDITAFIGVAIGHPRHFPAFDERVAALPEVLECHRVAGADSYLLKVKTANTRTLDHLLVDELRTIPGVTRTHTTIVLTSIKESSHVHIDAPARAGPARPRSRKRPVR